MQGLEDNWSFYVLLKMLVRFQLKPLFSLFAQVNNSVMTRMKMKIGKLFQLTEESARQGKSS